MANNIERLNYYEREHLRSFDFVAEQNYHLEMRRRLNIALHLWGVVEGLELKKGSIEPGLPEQVYITPGMAIDAYGREILLFTNHPLSEEDLDANHILTGGSYSLFIEYQKRLTTPPSPGFGICDLRDQYTRQSESYRIVITDKANPSTEPTLTSDISDDTSKHRWWVRLGTVLVGPDPVTNLRTILDGKSENRVYIGLRAQRVVTPADATKAFEVLKLNTAIEPATSLGVKANLFAEQNAIIGGDFEVKQADIVPPPPGAPAVFPNPTGNLKVSGDLFLNGNLYGNVGTKWLTLAEQIKALTPEILVGKKSIVVTDPGNGIETVTLSTSTLKKISTVKVVASIAAVTWADLSTRFEIFLAVGATAQLSYEIISASGAKHPTIDNSCNIDIAWKVGPTALLGVAPSQTFASAIVGLTFAYVVICYP